MQEQLDSFFFFFFFLIFFRYLFSGVACGFRTCTAEIFRGIKLLSIKKEIKIKANMRNLDYHTVLHETKNNLQMFTLDFK